MGVIPPIDITAEQHKTLSTLLERFLPEVKAWAYGSRAKWTSRPNSDLDLVVFAEPEQYRQVGELREAFEESNLPFRVDLFVWDDVPESFHDEIMENHVELLARKSSTGTLRDTAYGRFSMDFKESSLEHLCVPNKGIQTGPFGSQLHKSDYVPTGIPIVTVEHIADNRIVHDQNVPQVSTHDRQRLSKYVLCSGDIVFSRVGSVDRRALVRNTEEGWLFSGRCLRIRPDPNKIDPAYLSYFLGLPSFQEHVRAIAVGATMPSLNTQLLSDAMVSYAPDIDEQRAIAHILGTLDDKIELNQKINKTLEEIAKTIFKSWFVDFDPVRAKAEGRSTGLPPEISDLFPDKFDDDGKPTGWATISLGEIADAPKRGISPSEVAQDTPYIGLEHMPKCSMALTEWEGAVKVISNKLLFKKGEVLFGKLRPYFHKVGLAPLDGICSTDIVVVVSRDSDWSALILMYLSSDGFINYTDQTSTGTRMPRTSWRTMRQYKILLPEKGVVREFQHIVQPLLDRVMANIHNSRALASTRNVLLPKLISGEFRIPDVEKLLKKAGI